MNHEEGDEQYFYGLYRGVVVDTKGPQQRNRIRALVPQVHGDDASIWAMPCLSMAAWTAHPTHPTHATHSSHGFTDFNDGSESSGNHQQLLTHSPHDAHTAHGPHRKVPDVGMGVWMMFEAGDPEKPVWMGIWQAPEGGL